MPIAIVCNRCQSRFQVAETMAGKTRKCRTCGSPISVTEDEELQELEVAAPAPRPKPTLPRSRRIKTRRTSNGGHGIAIAIAGVFGIILLVSIGAVTAVMVGRGSGSTTSVGQQVATLSNLRAATGFVGREGYSVEVAVIGEPAIGIRYFLVLSQDGGKGEVGFAAADLKEGSLRVEKIFRDFSSSGRRGKITAWLEAALDGPERKRVSNVVQLN